ncbi:hypothetical protein HZ326_4443 [Fusarium oxysporum f. sp. albedinis]|nr:hypothetical protein HZ326_4443 [Fusarium oxysporum f. sp. albedinis]
MWVPDVDSRPHQLRIPLNVAKLAKNGRKPPFPHFPQLYRAAEVTVIHPFFSYSLSLPIPIHSLDLASPRWPLIRHSLLRIESLLNDISAVRPLFF